MKIENVTIELDRYHTWFHALNDADKKRVALVVNDFFREGFLMGLKRHTFMKDGVTYVGNGTYTLKEALERAVNEDLL